MTSTSSSECSASRVSDNRIRRVRPIPASAAFAFLVRSLTCHSNTPSTCVPARSASVTRRCESGQEHQCARKTGTSDIPPVLRAPSYQRPDNDRREDQKRQSHEQTLET